jgi:hypothetical protein
MPLTLEKRVEDLERKFIELSKQSGSTQKPDWRRTFGLSRDDEGFPDLVRLGQEIRRNCADLDQGADS